MTGVLWLGPPLEERTQQVTGDLLFGLLVPWDCVFTRGACLDHFTGVLMVGIFCCLCLAHCVSGDSDL